MDEFFDASDVVFPTVNLDGDRPLFMTLYDTSKWVECETCHGDDDDCDDCDGSGGYHPSTVINLDDPPDWYDATKVRRFEIQWNATGVATIDVDGNEY